MVEISRPDQSLPDQSLLSRSGTAKRSEASAGDSEARSRACAFRRLRLSRSALASRSFSASFGGVLGSPDMAAKKPQNRVPGKRPRDRPPPGPTSPHAASQQYDVIDHKIGAAGPRPRPYVAGVSRTGERHAQCLWTCCRRRLDRVWYDGSDGRHHAPCQSRRPQPFGLSSGNLPGRTLWRAKRIRRRRRAGHRRGLQPSAICP